MTGNRCESPLSGVKSVARRLTRIVHQTTSKQFAQVVHQPGVKPCDHSANRKEENRYTMLCSKQEVTVQACPGAQHVCDKSGSINDVGGCEPALSEHERSKEQRLRSCHTPYIDPDTLLGNHSNTTRIIASDGLSQVCHLKVKGEGDYRVCHNAACEPEHCNDSVGVSDCDQCCRTINVTKEKNPFQTPNRLPKHRKNTSVIEHNTCTSFAVDGFSDTVTHDTKHSSSLVRALYSAWGLFLQSSRMTNASKHKHGHVTHSTSSSPDSGTTSCARWLIFWLVTISLIMGTSSLLKCDRNSDCPRGGICFKDECSRCLCPKGQKFTKFYSDGVFSKICNPRSGVIRKVGEPCTPGSFPCPAGSYCDLDTGSCTCSEGLRPHADNTYCRQGTLGESCDTEVNVCDTYAHLTCRHARCECAVGYHAPTNWTRFVSSRWDYNTVNARMQICIARAVGEPCSKHADCSSVMGSGAVCSVCGFCECRISGHVPDVLGTQCGPGLRLGAPCSSLSSFVCDGQRGFSCGDVCSLYVNEVTESRCTCSQMHDSIDGECVPKSIGSSCSTDLDCFPISSGYGYCHQGLCRSNESTVEDNYIPFLSSRICKPPEKTQPTTPFHVVRPPHVPPTVDTTKPPPRTSRDKTPPPPAPTHPPTPSQTPPPTTTTTATKQAMNSDHATHKVKVMEGDDIIYPSLDDDVVTVEYEAVPVYKTPFIQPTRLQTKSAAASVYMWGTIAAQWVWFVSAVVFILYQV